MAKLSVAYPLCPLIDQKSLLGVSQDSANDCVIVTLGRNIVIRYKLLDQKQVSSWSSKDKLSCPVIFNEKDQQYVAVYNQNQVRVWVEGEQQFDQVKKLKFERHIHCILPQPDNDLPLVVFRDGSVSPLDVALRNRKNSTSLPDQVIQNCQLGVHEAEKYITFLTVSPKKTHFNIISANKNGYTSRMELKRQDTKLVGHTVIHGENNNCCLYSLWSDGQLFCAPLFRETQALPGAPVQTVGEVSAAHSVAMVPLGAHHIAMYGAHAGDEGAVLLVYNTRYGLVQARQRSKLFGLSPRLWLVGANLFFANGNYLAVVPYRLDVARLAALVGSHDSSDDGLARAVWEKRAGARFYRDVPDSIEGRLLELSEKGWPQFTIFQEILPDILENKDLDAILWCLRNIGDIPEVSIVALLNFCLSESDSTFDIANVEDSRTSTTKKQKFLDCILSVPFGEVYLVPHLRALSFSNTLALLRHLVYNMSEDGDAKTLEWVGHLLDSHYQQYLLGKDPEVLDVLSSLRTLVCSQLEDLEELKSLAPLVQRLSLGKPILKPTQMGENNYSIEMLYLY